MGSRGLECGGALRTRGRARLVEGRLDIGCELLEEQGSSYGHGILVRAERGFRPVGQESAARYPAEFDQRGDPAEGPGARSRKVLVATLTLDTQSLGPHARMSSEVALQQLQRLQRLQCCNRDRGITGLFGRIATECNDCN